ncbi:TetR/AcrR family transcriptional regulator [Micromonospora sp. NPDC047738]|uniref:TetR/AcrR family transcriptional regulator n=1 Tax=Micromonospora sp. NPDC047738 TaxID=3155741 RepID=UPI0033D99628
MRIASARGLQSASMREVAAEAGVSLRLVQYYFHTKEELLLTALAYLGERLATRVERHIRALGPVTPATSSTARSPRSCPPTPRAST